MEDMTVARYLIQRLQEIGLQQMFKVPGDHVDRIFKSNKPADREL